MSQVSSTPSHFLSLRMPGVATTFHQHGDSKKNFKSVFGFGSFNRSRSSVDSYLPRQSSRISLDTTRSFQPKRKSRQERPSVTDVSSDSLSSPSHHAHQDHIQNYKHDSNNPVRSMKSVDAAHTRPIRRPPVRIDAQEGPWSVSVAETPHDAHSYSIYIKSESSSCPLFFHSSVGRVFRYLRTSLLTGTRDIRVAIVYSAESCELRPPFYISELGHFSSCL